MRAQKREESKVGLQNLFLEEPRQVGLEEIFVLKEGIKIYFEKPSIQQNKHLKPLYIKAFIDGIPINRILVDNGEAVNILPLNLLQRLGKNESHLQSTDVTVCGFSRKITKSNGVFPVKLRVGNCLKIAAFFVVTAN
ncbi:hypothetical protein CFOL_v3_12465 [Cephalotus follicularis]|uniref:RVP_2 domain-containing protein n=1 Tax=Cephalotus follicularis TaxID=3775 RepID=A0A1Q3BMB0_CEPFO|nr:hypothetical protein CFOL_v3_12465 [Cephalotus follicularis]